MTPVTNKADYELHQRCWELLPWYHNGTLEADQHSMVEQHIKGCLSCRRELEQAAHLSLGLRHADDLGISAQQGLARQMARIRAAEKDSGGLLQRLQQWFAEQMDMLANSQPMVKGALAAQAFVIALGVGFFVWTGDSGQQPGFSTLSNPEAVIDSNAALYRIVFTPEASEQSIRNTLLPLSASIVDGPSARGAYTLAVDSQQPADQVLQQLRGNANVRMAEPVLGDQRDGS